MSKQKLRMAMSTLRRGRRPKRIQYAEEYVVPKTPGPLADAINAELGDRSRGDPRVVDIHPMFSRSPLFADEIHVLVMIERDERRADPSKTPNRPAERRKAPPPEVVTSLKRRRNGGGENDKG